jgi:hypothetical protein
VFSPEDVDFLEQFNPTAYKIASMEFTDTNLTGAGKTAASVGVKIGLTFVGAATPGSRKPYSKFPASHSTHGGVYGEWETPGGHRVQTWLLLWTWRFSKDVTAVIVLFDNASFFGQRTGSEAGRPTKAGNCLGEIIGLAIAIRGKALDAALAAMPARTTKSSLEQRSI